MNDNFKAKKTDNHIYIIHTVHYQCFIFKCDNIYTLIVYLYKSIPVYLLICGNAPPMRQIYLPIINNNNNNNNNNISIK